MRLRCLPALLGIAAIGCGASSGLVENVTPMRVRLFAPDGSRAVTMSSGDTIQLRCFVYYTSGDSSTGPYVETWQSRQPSIAAPSEARGRIVGYASGTTVLIVSILQFVDSIPVTVR